jgi:heat shock protein HslJ
MPLFWPWPGRRFPGRLALLFCACAIWPALASEPFPFGSELMLDAAPMHGSKRVPMIEIEDDGSASIDLWCASLRAQATLDGDSITIVPSQTLNNTSGGQCEPDRQASDAEILSALRAATNWRRAGEIIELSGPATLRFRLMTN